MFKPNELSQKRTRNHISLSHFPSISWPAMEQNGSFVLHFIIFISPPPLNNNNHSPLLDLVEHLLSSVVDQAEDIVEDEVASSTIRLELESLCVVHGLLLVIDQQSTCNKD